MLRILTAGESHGKALVGILSGFPAGFKINIKDINKELKKRQSFFGRGKRSRDIESDKVEILSGVRNNVTLGSPITFLIKNVDFKIFAQKPDNLAPISVPRPGHADLAGSLKFGFKDIRNVLERASARETAVRMCIGTLCKQFLKEFKIEIFSYVIRIGKINADLKNLDFYERKKKAESSEILCPDKSAEKKMKELILETQKKGDSLGGAFEVVVLGVLPGLGSYTDYFERLDAQLAQSLVSIPSVKGVEIGEAILGSQILGSDFQDPIFYSKKKGFYRKKNYAGGIEGGVSNGAPIILRGYCKPIPSIKIPLDSVNINTKKKEKSSYIRADTCVVPSAALIAESVTAIVILDNFLKKFGSDSFEDIKKNFENYLKRLK